MPEGGQAQLAGYTYDVRWIHSPRCA